MGNTKIAIIAVAVCAAVLLGGLSIGSIVSNNPVNQVEKALIKSLEAFEKSDIYEHYDSVANGGSVEVGGNFGDLTESYLGTKVDIDASAKLYFNVEELESAFEISASMDEEELIAAQLYASEKIVAVMCEALLGEESYGIKLDKIADNFAESEFGEDGAFALGITEEQLEIYLEAMETGEAVSKDVQKLAEEIIETFLKSVRKHAETEKEGGTIRISGEEVKTNNVIIIINGEAMVNIATDMLEYLEKDKTVKNFLEDYAETLISVSGEDLDADDMIDGFYDSIEDVLDNIDDMEDSVEDIEFIITANISKSNGQLIGLTAEAEYDGDSMFEAGFVCGPTWKEITDISVYYEMGGQKMSVNFNVKENSKQTLEAVVKVKQGTNTMAEATFEWDKKENEFSISAGAAGEQITLKGELTVKSGVSTLVLGSVKIGEEKIDLGDINVIIDESDKMPSAKNVTDILTMTEDEIMDLIEAVQEAAMELGEDLMGELGGLGGLGGIGGGAEEDIVVPDAMPGYEEDYGW